MNFVYPYKRKDNDFLITQSIRLVRKFYSESVIYVIGDNPNIEEINHIPFKDNLVIRGANVTAKLLHVAKLVDSFVFMNDDFLIGKRLDFNQVLCGNELLERKEGKASISWNQAVDNTKHYLEHNELSTITFECHQPTLLDSKLLIELFNDINWMEYDHFIKSLYFNTYPLYEFIPMVNCKLITPNIQKTTDLINRYGCFSVGNGFLNESTVNFIKGL